MPKKKKAAKAAPAGMAVSTALGAETFAERLQGREANRPPPKALPGATKPSAPPAVMSTPAARPAPKIPGMVAVAPAAPKMPVMGAVSVGALRAPPAVPGRAALPPPPHPPPAAGPPKELYKALYSFSGQPGEIQLVKGEEVEVKEKDDNGWWMVVKNGEEGWAPSN